MRVKVRTPSRLHFSMVDLRGDLGRIFGSVGVAIDRPNIVLEAEPIAPVLLGWFAGRSSWDGSSQELLDQLSRHAGESVRQSKRWPSSARGLSGRLRRLAPTVLDHGVELEFLRQAGGSRTRTIAIRHSGGHDRPDRPDRPGDEASADSTAPSTTSRGRFFSAASCVLASKKSLFIMELILQ